jgi:DNA polymerase-3 subunit delta'
VGKFHVARWWASLLLCPQGGACGGTCENCRLVAGAVHPDVFETGPAPKDKNALQKADEDIERKKSVGIAESRALLQRLAMRPVRGALRVAIMREAGTMTVEAQNALLKMLEEPPGRAVIVLVTDNVGAMLPTVRSRCRHLAFGALTDAEVAAVLVGHGWPQAAAAAAAACARGNAARALTYDPDGLADREALVLAWEAARRDDAAADELVDSLVALKEHGHGLPELLEWQLARIHAALGRRGAEPSPALAAVLDAAAGAQARREVEAAAHVETAMDAIARNGNPRLVIRDLLLNVRA